MVFKNIYFFRYRKWDLGNDIKLVARCETDAVAQGPNNEMQFINIKALNEWDSKVKFYFCGKTPLAAFKMMFVSFV